MNTLKPGDRVIVACRIRLGLYSGQWIASVSLAPGSPIKTWTGFGPDDAYLDADERPLRREFIPHGHEFPGFVRALYLGGDGDSCVVRFPDGRELPVPSARVGSEETFD